jgi:signal transduction histidine kinase
MGIRNRIILLNVLSLGAGMVFWGMIQLERLGALLYRQQENSMTMVAETVSTYYQHFPTEEGLEALDRALEEQLNEDKGLARIDLLSLSNGIVDYLSGVGRIPFEWSFDLVSSILNGSRFMFFPLELDGDSAMGLVYSVQQGEQGVDSKARIYVCVIANTRSNDELLSNARTLLIYSSVGLLLFILAVLMFSFGWLIGSPLKEIMRIIDKFQAGEFGKRISINRKDELGRLAGHFNAMADEIQRVMARNKELNMRQEERIKEATRRLGELQTQISQLQRFSAMGLLAANFAHDLGTPLHSIAGMAALMLERPTLAQDDRRKLEVIVGQAERLSGIIKDVRRATRMPEPRPEPTNAAPLFEETALLLEPLLRNYPVRLKINVAEGCPMLLVDRHRIQTAIMNLVQNSLEAMEGEGEIRLSAFPSEDPSIVVITVEDTGRGIPPDILDKVCEPFFSTHKGEVLRGLGLAIVKEVIKAHGGRMEMTSNPGEGTSVKLYLPSGGIPEPAFGKSP